MVYYILFKLSFVNLNIFLKGNLTFVIIVGKFLKKDSIESQTRVDFKEKSQNTNSWLKRKKQFFLENKNTF